MILQLIGYMTEGTTRNLGTRIPERSQTNIYIYMGVGQNIVAGVLLETVLRPPLRFLALFRVFIVFHYID